MHAAKGKIRMAKVGPDKEIPKRSDEYGSKNKCCENESKNFGKNMPGGNMRISNGKLPK